MVLTCISLASNVDHLLMNLLTICMLSLGKCLFRSSAYLFNHIFFFWVVWVLLIFWILLLSWIYHLQIFSPIQDLTFLCTWWFPLLCSNVIVHYNLFFWLLMSDPKKSSSGNASLFMKFMVCIIILQFEYNIGCYGKWFCIFFLI